MDMIELMRTLLVKNRTIVSSDMQECMDLIAKEIPLTVHRYASGEEHGTWVVPPRWDVVGATLSDGERVLASYDQHPLFVAPYSTPFTGWVTREELLEHVKTVPRLPDAYFYEHRLASDHRRRLRDWVITLPHHLVEQLTESRYLVDLRFDTGDGHMLVAESSLRGRHEATFALLTHLCHPGQANDGLAGVAVGVEVMRRLRARLSRPEYSYRLLVMPETIGSAVHLAANEATIPEYLGAVFIEMAGIRSPIRLGHTRRGDTYVDRVLKHVLTESGHPFTECAWMEQWGNDELVFDSPGVGIPTASLERYPYDCYHTSEDDMAATDERSLEELVEILLQAVATIESDFIPRPRQKVPIYLTRYDLYADAVERRSEYDLNLAILEALWSGMSVFDAALKLGAPFARVRDYVQRMVDLGLVEQLPLTPAYVRHGATPFNG